jgi:serine/threonine-protein kinase
MDDTPPAERLADRYVLRERIARGGMASVWRADDEVLARPVAIKILHQDLAKDATFLERFRQEAMSAARLSHPRIVRVFDTGTDGALTFIVMELFEGEDLAAVLKRGPLDPDRAAWIVSCALEGLAHAHEQGLVHRDVKPGNILVGEDGIVKVTDFGVAKAAFSQDLTTTGRVLGTVSYLAPEQIQGGALDGRSDLYSAGVVLYEALTGRAPFVGETDLATATMRLTEDPMPPRAVRAGIPRGLEKVIMTALARDPEQRYASAEDMRLAIGRALGDSTGEIRAVPAAPPRAPAPARDEHGHDEPSFFRRWGLIPLILVALAAAVAAVGLILGQLGVGPLVPGPDGGGDGGGELTIASAADFDPSGDDRAENPGEVPLAIDGQDETAWETDRYNSALLGGLKSGVGLRVELESEAEIGRLVIQSPLIGWTFQVYAADGLSADGPPDPTGARPNTDGDRVFTVEDGVAEIDLEPFRGRTVLIWITGLAPEEGGGFRASIAEVTVQAAE